LAEVFTLSPAEVEWARQDAGRQHLLAPLVWLKAYQRVAYRQQ
jgi:hypothetical protein